MDVRGGS